MRGFYERSVQSEKSPQMHTALPPLSSPLHVNTFILNQRAKLQTRHAREELRMTPQTFGLEPSSENSLVQQIWTVGSGYLIPLATAV